MQEPRFRRIMVMSYALLAGFVVLAALDASSCDSNQSCSPCRTGTHPMNPTENCSACVPDGGGSAAIGGNAGGAAGTGGAAGGGGGGAGHGGTGGALSLSPGCCQSQNDCPGPTNRQCVLSTASQTGVCEAGIPSDSNVCWNDSDCFNGQSCVGARVCPCGAQCLVADQPGECARP